MVSSSTNQTALIYCRVSTRGQEQDGTSLDTQEAACRAHAEAGGYTVAGVFKDVYSGAEIFDRPQLTALRDEVRTSRHAAIVVYAIDQSTGMIAPVDWTPIGGKTPRNFNLDPTGSYLYAEAFDSDTIRVFSVDGATGRLTPTGQVIETGSPVCMIFGKV